MNITSFDITQASVDIFFSLFCVIILVTIKANNPKSKSMKIFVQLFTIATLLFFGEALAYIFRGNLGMFNIVINRVSNLIVFVMNVVLANIYVRYIYSLTKAEESDRKNKYLRIVNILSCISLLIVVVNLFCSWMYYFDEANYYHRNYMWYVYTVVTLAVIFMGAGVAIKHRKSVNTHSYYTAVFFAFIPIIAIVAQVFVYGIALANIGLGIGLFAMFIAYLYDWTHDNAEQMEQVKNSRFDIIILFLIMVLSMSVSIIASGRTIQRVSKENLLMQNQTISQVVAAGIENEFTKPITVSQTISQDLNVWSYISASSKEEAEMAENDMAAYLEAIKNGFGYQMAYAVADRSKAFYTSDGISKFIDVANDKHDIWYKEYLDSGKRYVLNVDTDEDNNWELSVFVNYGIEDNNGEFLGVCGIGVSVNDLIALIHKYEEEYNIKIDLVNRDGLVQVDSNYSSIETDYLDNSYFDQIPKSDFYHQDENNSCYMTKYIEELDWYLVIKNDNSAQIDIVKILFPIVLIFIFGVIIMAVTFGVLSIRERRAKEAYSRRYEVSIKDELTGLYNRRKYEDDSAEIIKEDMATGLSIIMIDINGLKAINDSKGHEAGDELIIGAANCMNNAFSGLGNVYRVGGDEFVVLLNCSKEKVYDTVNTLDYLTASWKGKNISEISLSKGIVVCSEFPELTFEEMKVMADKRMYDDKNEYYRKTGINRRRF